MSKKQCDPKLLCDPQELQQNNGNLQNWLALDIICILLEIEGTFLHFFSSSLWHFSSSPIVKFHYQLQTFSSRWQHVLLATFVCHFHQKCPQAMPACLQFFAGLLSWWSTGAVLVGCCADCWESAAIINTHIFLIKIPLSWAKLTHMSRIWICTHTLI